MTGLPAFLDRLAQALPGWPDELPPHYKALRRLTEYRVAQGEERYGSRWEDPDFDLLANAWEEVSDFVAYVAKDAELHDFEDVDLSLMAAFHVCQGAEMLGRLREKRGGAP